MLKEMRLSVPYWGPEGPAVSGTPACSRRRQCGQEQVSWSARSPPDSLLSLSCPLEPCPWWHQLPRTLEREMLLQVFPNLECKCENMGFATERSEHSCSSAVPRRLSLTNDFASLNLSFPFPWVCCKALRDDASTLGRATCSRREGCPGKHRLRHRQGVPAHPVRVEEEQGWAQSPMRGMLRKPVVGLNKEIPESVWKGASRPANLVICYHRHAC